MARFIGCRRFNGRGVSVKQTFCGRRRLAFRLRENQASSFHNENSRFVNSHHDRARTGNPHPLDGHALHARGPVGTQDVKGLVGTIHAAEATQKHQSQKLKL